MLSPHRCPSFATTFIAFNFLFYLKCSRSPSSCSSVCHMSQSGSQLLQHLQCVVVSPVCVWEGIPHSPPNLPPTLTSLLLSLLNPFPSSSIVPFSFPCPAVLCSNHYNTCFYCTFPPCYLMNLSWLWSTSKFSCFQSHCFYHLLSLPHSHGNVIYITYFLIPTSFL